MATPKFYVAGEVGSPLRSTTGAPVRIEDIRAKHGKDNLFTDPDFPPCHESVGDVLGDIARQQGLGAPKFKWARPHDICKTLGIEKPEFATVQDTFSRSRCSENDLVQGSIGDCWYVAAVQALARKPEQLAIVIPEDNYTGFDPENYCGAFHFRFYIMADDKWVDIVVDDWLPVVPEGGLGLGAGIDDVLPLPPGAPVMAAVTSGAHPKEAEFWCALIEKAYAKLHGSYRGIEMGMAHHALEDFTGGFAEYVFLKNPKDHNLGGQFFIDTFLNPEKIIREMLLKLVERDCFFALGSYGPSDPVYKTEALQGYTELGLVGPHVYTILDVQEVALKQPGCKDEAKVLVKIRNPHGKREWTGPFSDKDDAGWATLARDLRYRNVETGSADIDEGVFWMELVNVIKYFNTLQICYYSRTALGNDANVSLDVVEGVWGPELQTLVEPPTAAELGRYKAYKFEVLHGEGAKKYAAEHGVEGDDKALVGFTLVIEGYNSTWAGAPVAFVRLYRLLAPDEPMKAVLEREPICEEQTVARETGAWTFVEPGWYALLPRLYTGEVPAGQALFPPAVAGKEINFALRLFTENETKLVEFN